MSSLSEYLLGLYMRDDVIVGETEGGILAEFDACWGGDVCSGGIGVLSTCFKRVSINASLADICSTKLVICCVCFSSCLLLLLLLLFVEMFLGWGVEHESSGRRGSGYFLQRGSTWGPQKLTQEEVVRRILRILTPHPRGLESCRAESEYVARLLSTHPWLELLWSVWMASQVSVVGLCLAPCRAGGLWRGRRRGEGWGRAGARCYGDL